MMRAGEPIRRTAARMPPTGERLTRMVGSTRPVVR